MLFLVIIKVSRFVGFEDRRRVTTVHQTFVMAKDQEEADSKASVIAETFKVRGNITFEAASEGNTIENGDIGEC